MPEAKNAETVSVTDAIRKSFRELADTFYHLMHAPRALWGLNIAYFLEGLVYFGILTVVGIHLSENVGVGDQWSSWVLMIFTGGITLSQTLLGSVSDRIGVRRALLWALGILFVGRLLIALAAELFPDLLAPFSPFGTVITRTLETGNIPQFIMIFAGLMVVIVGYGLFQPAAYSAVKQFTDEKTSAVGYAMLYALMNLGAFVSGILSPEIRSIGGVATVFDLYAVLTFLAFISVAVILTKAVVAKGTLTKISEDKKEGESKKSMLHDFMEVLSDGRFMFFIFILIPVQTLFAHNWLTLPYYIKRALPNWVASRYEFFSNINPILIFFLTPLVAALTARANVYRMMIYGTLVMALPTFLLALGPNPWILLLYILLMSVGEAMWQPRFLQMVAEIAPKGKTGTYMGIAQVPWFLTKMITGAYAGWFLEKFCPATGVRHTEIMWLIYALIAMITPVALILAKSWIASELQKKVDAAKEN